jgi:hypothetical protein
MGEPNPTEPALPYVEIVFIGLQIPADPFLSFTIICLEKERKIIEGAGFWIDIFSLIALPAISLSMRALQPATKLQL